MEVSKEPYKSSPFVKMAEVYDSESFHSKVVIGSLGMQQLF